MMNTVVYKPMFDWGVPFRLVAYIKETRSLINVENPELKRHQVIMWGDKRPRNQVTTGFLYLSLCVYINIKKIIFVNCTFFLVHFN